MAQINRTAIEIWKMRFRRLYSATEELRATLAALTTEWASDAAELVTFTQAQMEGGGASGQITGNRLEVLAAAEELLMDPLFLAGINAPLPRTIQPDYTLCRP